MFYECLDLMTEQCRNARLDLHTFECQHLFSHSVAKSSLCPGGLFFFFSCKNENNLFYVKIIAYWMMSTASVYFPLLVIFYGQLVNPFWFFFDSSASCLTLLNKQWNLDWCLSDTWSGDVKRATRLKWTNPTKDDWNPWDANKLCLHPRSTHTG